jgi:hypothetical protein
MNQALFAIKAKIGNGATCPHTLNFWKFRCPNCSIFTNEICDNSGLDLNLEVQHFWDAKGLAQCCSTLP